MMNGERSRVNNLEFYWNAKVETKFARLMLSLDHHQRLDRHTEVKSFSVWTVYVNGKDVQTIILCLIYTAVVSSYKNQNLWRIIAKNYFGANIKTVK